VIKFPLEDWRRKRRNGKKRPTFGLYGKKTGRGATEIIFSDKRRKKHAEEQNWGKSRRRKSRSVSGRMERS